MRGGKGQSQTFAQVILVVLVAYLVFFGLVTVLNLDKGWLDAMQVASSSISDFTLKILGPFFGVLLNLGSDSNVNFLMVLTFVLISIIVVGTLDSVNIFGEDRQGGLINLAVGIIISIIGIRFMPANMWSSLTAPSTAFVATILVGAPFFALFVLTVKLKFRLLTKLIWLFYLIFLSYIIFYPNSGLVVINEFRWIYGTFLVLGAVMLFFDATVRRYWYREKNRLEVEKMLGTKSVKDRRKLRLDIRTWQDVIADPSAPVADRNIAKREINKLKALYGDLSSV